MLWMHSWCGSSSSYCCTSTTPGVSPDRVHQKTQPTAPVMLSSTAGRVQRQSPGVLPPLPLPHTHLALRTQQHTVPTPSPQQWYRVPTGRYPAARKCLPLMNVPNPETDSSSTRNTGPLLGCLLPRAPQLLAMLGAHSLHQMVSIPCDCPWACSGCTSTHTKEPAACRGSPCTMSTHPQRARHKAHMGIATQWRTSTTTGPCVLSSRSAAPAGCRRSQAQMAATPAPSTHDGQH